jgi:hypothetical protein
MDIHRADPAYRTRTLLLLALTVLACVVFLLLLHAWLERVSGQLLSSDPETLRNWLRGMLVGLGLALAIPALFVGTALRRLAVEARRERRFPPMDWKTIRDVRVLRDDVAIHWAARTQILGNAVLGLAGVFVLWALWALWRFG